MVHLLLDNSSQVEVNAVLEDDTFSKIEILGSSLSMKILEFDREYNSRIKQLGGNHNKLQEQYIKMGIDNYIRSYVDSCTSALNGVYALYHIEEKETDFLKNSEFYFSFQEKVKAQYPENLYTQKYNELLQSLVGFRDIVCEIPGVSPKWKDYLIIAESVIIFILLITLLAVRYQKKARATISEKSTTTEAQNLYEKLTNKEKEIFKLIAEGKSNKEIAVLMFVELSTVKTHVSNIYRQIKVENRKEAISLFKLLEIS